MFECTEGGSKKKRKCFIHINRFFRNIHVNTFKNNNGSLELL